MLVHILKTDPETFMQSWIGVKKYEIRQNDRGYQVGDILELKETVYSGVEMLNGKPFELTGREIFCDVSHVLTGYGLNKDWCILSVVNMHQSSTEKLIQQVEDKYMIVHLMTQNDQPYGSIRKCCEVCGYMPGAYTEDPKAFEELQKTGEVGGNKHTACTNPFEGK